MPSFFSFLKWLFIREYPPFSAAEKPTHPAGSQGPTCCGQCFGRDPREFGTEAGDGRPHEKKRYASFVDDSVGTIVEI